MPDPYWPCFCGMKSRNILLTLCIGLVVLLSGCQTITNRPEIPKNTVGSFNFVKGPDGKFKLVVIGKNGKIVGSGAIHDKKFYMSHKSVKLKNNEVRMYFKNGSCTVLVCLPGTPCTPVVIDPVNDCPAF